MPGLGGSYQTSGDRGHTVGQHSFAMIPAVNVQRSVFNRSCGLKTTFSAGTLIPVFADEVLPGDTFTMRMNAFGRLSTLLRPIMENIYFDYFFFYVPNRLLWTNWKKFCGEQTNPGDSTTFVIPVMTPPAAGWQEGSIADYLGWPLQVVNGITGCSALWHRGYALIWNEWFRDENLQNSIAVATGDGPDAATLYTIQPRGKRHDYFTSCLPFPQKGTAVALPLGTTAPVIPVNDVQPVFRRVGNATDLPMIANAGAGASFATSAVSPSQGAVEWQVTGLVANLAGATAATINQIREAFQIQRMFEKDARGGTRYTEVIRAHFGVTSPDGRQNRPEYLGGGTSRINVNPIAQTNNLASGYKLGELAAFGTTSAQGIGFTKSFTEHGIILGLVSARADLTYQDGVERMYSRQSRFDFYWPSLSHLGEQPVLNKEIYADQSANDNLVFGYQERYAEYRYKPSRVTGKFRSDLVDTLEVYHLAQDFDALPVLNASFIVENPPLARILAVTIPTQPAFLLDAYFDFRCARPMPTYGVPGLIDHF